MTWKTDAILHAISDPRRHFARGPENGVLGNESCDSARIALHEEPETVFTIIMRAEIPLHLDPSQARLIPNIYISPSPYSLVTHLENKLLAADDSWWTGRYPLHSRVAAAVPHALYLNYLVEKSHIVSSTPYLFRLLDLPGDSGSTLFTILLFSLERARPVWVPEVFGALAPRIMQSNWRFYGHITEHGSDSRRGVLLVRTVTTSLMLSVFGRRLARCFPLRRAHRMRLDWAAGRLAAVIDPGPGTAPELAFEGEKNELPQVDGVFCDQFRSYDEYARWIIDQHLSLTFWPREYVVQDMHLDFEKAKIIPLRCLRCRIPDLVDFVHDEIRVIDCFAVEGLKVFLDKIYSVTQSLASVS